MPDNLVYFERESGLKQTKHIQLSTRKHPQFSDPEPCFLGCAVCVSSTTKREGERKARRADRQGKDERGRGRRSSSGRDTAERSMLAPTSPAPAFSWSRHLSLSLPGHQRPLLSSREGRARGWPRPPQPHGPGGCNALDHDLPVTWALCLGDAPCQLNFHQDDICIWQ